MKILRFNESSENENVDVVEFLSIFQDLFDEFFITEYKPLAWANISEKYPENSITYSYKIVGDQSSSTLDLNKETNSRLKITIAFTGDKIDSRDRVESYARQYLESRFETLGCRFFIDTDDWVKGDIEVLLLDFEIYRPSY